MVDKEEFPSNSHYHKETQDEEAEKKVVQKIVTGPISDRQRTLGERIKRAFTGDDARSVGSYLLGDVIKPAFQDLIYDVILQGASRTIYNDDSGRGGSRGGRGSKPGYTSYNRVYTPSTRQRAEAERDNRARPSHAFPDILFEGSRAEAEEVLDQLTLSVEEYGSVSVNDYKEMVGRTGEFTDVKWGWTNLRDAQVRRTRGGWFIEFPKPMPL